MKKCKMSEKLIHLYHTGVLTESEKNDVLEHSAQCTSCRVELKKLEALFQMLSKDTVPEMPEAFWGKYNKTVFDMIDRKEDKKRVYSFRPAFAFLSVIILIFGAVVFMNTVNNSIKQGYAGQTALVDRTVKTEESTFSERGVTSASGNFETAAIAETENIATDEAVENDILAEEIVLLAELGEDMSDIYGVIGIDDVPGAENI